MNVKPVVVIVRTERRVPVEVESHFFFSGFGHRRVLINDGQPDVLNAGNLSGFISGRIDAPNGTLRIVRIEGANNWYSVKATGRGTLGSPTVYLRGDTMVVADGVTYTLSEVYDLA